MVRGLLLVVGLTCLFTQSLARNADEGKKNNNPRRFHSIDLQAKANHKLKDQFPAAQFPNNDLSNLPQGEQTLAEVKFNIGPRYIVLGSTKLTGAPDKIRGIGVDKRFAKLHILHSAAWCQEEGVRLGEYTIIWEDDTVATIPIVSGEDVCDWWFAEGSPNPSRGTVAWEGENDASKAVGLGIRLYLTTWDNPKPDKKVKTIEFSSTKTTICAPFCLALTIEEK